MNRFLSFLVSLVVAVLVFAGLRFALTEWFGMDHDTARWVGLALGLLILIPGRILLDRVLSSRSGSDRTR